MKRVLIRLLAVMALLALLPLLVSCSARSENELARGCASRQDCLDGQRCTAQGMCSIQSKACEASRDCEFDEYCAQGACQAAVCADDAACTPGHVCLEGWCRTGCRPGQGACPEGQHCSSLTLACEPAGCTPASCRPRIQTCEAQLDPPACVFNGACERDEHCTAYARQIGAQARYLCDPVSRQCLPEPGCLADTDCGDADVCEKTDDQAQGHCRAGCRSSEDCPAGSLCSPEQGRVCVQGCESSADCPADAGGRPVHCVALGCVPQCESRDDCPMAGQICSGTPRHCQGCTDDSQCPSTQFCNLSTSLCEDLPPACPQDRYGDNHAPASAFAILDQRLDATGENQPYHCRQNAAGDWFSIALAPGMVLTASLDYDTDDGNLDLALLRQDASTAAQSARPPSMDLGQEALRYGSELGGTYLVQVRGALTGQSARYGLRLAGEPVGACEADSLDPNSPEQPATLPVATPLGDLSVCSDIPDVFALQVEANQNVRITAQAPVRFGAVVLTLLDSDGQVVATTDGRDDSPTILYNSRRAQQLTLLVRVATGVGKVRYALEWNQLVNQCADPYEPNDQCPLAPLVTSGSFENLAVCTDADWYAIDLLPMQTLTVSAVYDPAGSAGELDLALYGPDDCLRRLRNGTELSLPDGLVAETLSFQPQRGGRFYVHAYLFQGIRVSYRLEVDVQSGSACQDDTREPNSSPEQATVLPREQILDATQLALFDLRICDADADWFALDLEPLDELDVEIRFSQSEGDLDAVLIAPDGLRVLEESTVHNASESLHYLVPEDRPGRYYIKVQGSYPQRTGYGINLYLNGVGPQNPACPDRFGANLTRSSAQTLDPGNYQGLLACGSIAADDWFRTFVRAGESLAISARYDAGVGPLELTLFDDTASAVPLRRANSGTGVESVVFRSTRDQYLYFRASVSASVARLAYDLDVSLQLPDPCTPGRYQNHHRLADAIAIQTPSLQSRLQTCDAHSDWYRVELDAGENFEAYVRYDLRDGDLDVAIWGPDEGSANPASSAPVLLDQASTAVSNESLLAQAAVAGTYYIQVIPKVPARVPYDLLLYRDVNGDAQLDGPADRRCPDAFENNDSYAAAAHISASAHLDLLSCWGAGAEADNDYYAIFVPAGVTLSVTLGFQHQMGDLQVAIYRGTQIGSPPVAEGISSDDDEFVRVTNVGSGETYIVRVYGATGAVYRNHYDMDINLGYVGNCEDTPLAGLSLQQSNDLAAGFYRDQRLCEGREHWYTLDVGDNEDIHVGIEHAVRFGDLDAHLYDAELNLVAAAESTASLESIERTSLPAGTYFLRIYPKANALLRTDYNLSLRLGERGPQGPVCSDPFERNESPSSAFLLDHRSENFFVNPKMCGSEMDWYAVEVRPNYFLDLNVFFDRTEVTQLAVEVRDSLGQIVSDVQGVPLAFATQVADSDFITRFRPPSGGLFYIGVQNAAPVPGDERYMIFARERTLLTCTEDAYEPNNEPASAHDLGTQLPTRLGLAACASADHFLWTAPESTAVQVKAFFDGQLHNLGLTVETWPRQGLPTIVVDDAAGDGNTPNRAGGHFSAIAGQTYLVSITRLPPDGNTVPASGPYFLEIR